MFITDCPGGKLIILSKAFDTRPKFLNGLYFLCATGTGVGFFRMAANDEFTMGSALFIIGVVSVYLFVGFKFLNKALETEKLIVLKNSIIISKAGFLSKQTNAYNTIDIANFRHLDKEAITKHPLAGQSFDYLGFQTQQTVINEMYGDNRLAFDYDGGTVKFGDNIYSWDYEQVKAVLLEITGNDFSPPKRFRKTVVEGNNFEI